MTQYRRLAALFRETDEVLTRWSAAFETSELRMPSGLATLDIRPVMASIVEELFQALPRERSDGRVIPGGLEPGSAAVRDLEKAAAFVGGALNGLGGSGFDVATSFIALRAVALAAEPAEAAAITRAFEWLTVIAMDSYAQAGSAAAAEKQRAQLEQGTPVVLLMPFLPATLLVGQPDRMGLDTILSRLLLAVVRVGAKVAIIDATGLIDPLAEDVLISLSGFVGHRKISGRLEINAVGLDREHIESWSAVCEPAEVGFRHHELFASAMGDALTRSGYGLQRLAEK